MQVGTPLGDQEDRQHQHTYTAGVQPFPPRTLPRWTVVTIRALTRRPYMVPGTTDKVASGLPFVQVQPCVKQ